MQSYEHFTLGERESLYMLKKEGKSIRAIARETGRSPSTISRELKRNQDKDGRYNAWNATLHYMRRRKKSRRHLRFEQESALKTWTIERLQEFWPPETIAAVWKKAHPGERISHTSIYRAIKAGILPDITEEQHLRRRGKLKFKARNTASVKAEHRIRDWPCQIVNRQRIGDWEGDTVRGAQGKGAILTLVDRNTRFLVARLCKDRRADTTNDAILAAMAGLPVQSLSFDNGPEFSQYRTIEALLNTTVYFADPHCPWQRGTNENTNGLLRFFFPKSADMLAFSQHDLQAVVDLINLRPRKCLGWLSPAQLFFSKCCT